MRQRTLVALTTTLATLGVVLTASAAPPSHADRPAPARVTLEGVVSEWDADAPSITLEDPDVYGGSRSARRSLRSLDEVELGIGPRTRIVTEDDDGVRERIDAEELFAALDDSVEDLDLEAVGLVERRADRVAGTAPKVTAKRIVLHLPALDAEDVDEGDADEDLSDTPPGPGGEPGPEDRPGRGPR